MTEPEAVILVHGLWVPGVVMALLQRRIGRCGYRTLNYTYPSMRLTLTENAERLARYCRGIGAARLNFVGHSMGGLVVLGMLERPREFAIGRIVLAGTPCGGSVAARMLARLPGGRAALGCCLPEWLGRERPQTRQHEAVPDRVRVRDAPAVEEDGSDRVRESAGDQPENGLERELP